MADTFRIIPYVVRSAGTDVPPEEVQAAVNSLAQQTTIALNSVASDPTGPAGGDLSGTYPNPTVTTLHVTGGTESGVAVTGNTINNSPIGGTTPSTGAFTTATAGSLFASGGAVPAVTATGTQIYNSPNPTVQFIDSIRSANNKNAFVTWGSTVLAFGFANDAFTGFTNALAITGGQASGISGITSTSGTGAWAHTGGFSATGGINSTNVGATTPGTGAFTTLSATSTVSGAGFTTFFASPPPIGSTAANTGAFTTLSASSTVSGTGFVNRFASPGPIGNTAASTGAFTTLSSTGTFTPSSTNGIVGTTTNDNANAGSVGETLTANTTGTALTTGVVANATSISLTAGDWDVTGVVQFSPAAGTTTTAIQAGVNTVSAAYQVITGSFLNIQAIVGISSVGSTALNLTAPVTRISLSTTTTVFLPCAAAFSGSTMTASGFIRARRVR